MAGAGRLANEVRIGLEVSASSEPKQELATKGAKGSALDESWMGKPVRVHVREFGAIFATIFLVVCAAKGWRGVEASQVALWGAAGVATALLGYCAPFVLLPIWRAWMKLAHYLSIVMTFVILGLAWAIGFVPMAGLLKVLRIKAMDLSYRANVPSYWEKRDAKYDDFQRLKLQY